MSVDEFIKIMGGLGLGASAGAILTALINTRSNKGKSRAEAADLLVGAAERVGRINAEMDVEMRTLRTLLIDAQVLLTAYANSQISQQEYLRRADQILHAPFILHSVKEKLEEI